MPQPSPTRGANAGQHLRVGVLCEGPLLAAWQARGLEALVAVGGVDPVVVITGRGGSERRASGLWPAFRTGYVARRSRALRPVDVSGVLAPLLQVTVDTIEPLGLDVLVQLSSSPGSARLARLARHGIWSLHFGDDREDAAGVAPGFWEILHGTAVVKAELVSRRDSGTVRLGQAFFSTRAHSYVHTLDDVLFGAADLPARVVRSILAGAEPSAESAPRAISSLRRRAGPPRPLNRPTAR